MSLSLGIPDELGPALGPAEAGQIEEDYFLVMRCSVLIRILGFIKPRIHKTILPLLHVAKRC